MMTINNKTEINDRGRCLEGLLLAMALVMEFLVDIKYIIHYRKKRQIQIQIQSPAKHVFWTVQDGNKPSFSQTFRNINFNLLFSLTIVIFPLGQYYISFRRLTGFHLHRDYLPGSKVSYQGGLMFTPKCMIIYPCTVS